MSYMNCFRVLLAVLYFNENGQRAQSLTKEGQLKWGVSHPKGRQGEAVLKAVKVPQTYSKCTCIHSEIMQLFYQLYS